MVRMLLGNDFSSALAHDPEPIRNHELAPPLLLETIKLLLNAAGMRKERSLSFRLITKNLSAGIIQLVFARPDRADQRFALEKFVTDVAYFRDQVNGYSADGDQMYYCIEDGSFDDDDDDDNNLQVLYQEDNYVIVGTISDVISGLMNYLSFYDLDDLDKHADDLCFDKLPSLTQACFNLAYGYRHN